MASSMKNLFQGANRKASLWKYLPDECRQGKRMTSFPIKGLLSRKHILLQIADRLAHKKAPGNFLYPKRAPGKSPKKKSKNVHGQGKRQVVWKSAWHDRHCGGVILAVQKLKNEIGEKASHLPEMPFLYRTGRVTGTRKMLAGEKHILLYSVKENRSLMLCIMHAAQKWP